MRYKVTSESGVALILATFATVFVTLLLAAMLDMLYIDTKVIYNHYKTQETFYAAEAGLEVVYAILKNDPNWNAGFTDVAMPEGSSMLVTVSVDNTNFPYIDVISTARKSSYRKTSRATYRVSGATAPYFIYVISRQ